MKLTRSLLGALFVVFALAACSGSDDDGGSSGGSGTADASAPSSATTSGQGKIYLKAASDFSCTSNWTVRDGAWGLAAYSGSGSCVASFPGASGTYSVTLTIQTEFDGQPPYKVSVNGQTIKSGVYPLSSSLGCKCPADDWRSQCPDRKVNVNCGTVQLNKGDKIEFWGDDVYPCGHDHGAYAKWHGITFNPVN